MWRLLLLRRIALSGTLFWSPLTPLVKERVYLPCHLLLKSPSPTGLLPTYTLANCCISSDEFNSSSFNISQLIVFSWYPSTDVPGRCTPIFIFIPCLFLLSQKQDLSCQWSITSPLHIPQNKKTTKSLDYLHILDILIAKKHFHIGWCTCTHLYHSCKLKTHRHWLTTLNIQWSKHQGFYLRKEHQHDAITEMKAVSATFITPLSTCLFVE